MIKHTHLIISALALAMASALALASANATPLPDPDGTVQSTVQSTIPDDGHAYAIVVGSNPGGEGQEELRYAERDASRVAALLGELGGYHAERIHLLERPSAADLMATIDRVAAQVKADADRGLEPRFFFYYSGHARSSALELGAERVPLDELRQRLLSTGSALTVVVLDACQSGAFSRVKGAGPAADFSFNSVSRLNAKGIAVMASSSASELSQESERLGSSYFTHHLLVALRGAGDDNGDGRVSLDEAYEYAYQRTLVSTARTAVGSQHVTLETDLSGKGTVALSYPARADSRLALPPALAADILVHIRPDGAVIAELHKSQGAPVDLALPHGSYRILVRDPSPGRAGDPGPAIKRCDIDLARGARTSLTPEVMARVCQDAPLELTSSKGMGPGPMGSSMSPGIETSAPGATGPGQFSFNRVGLELGIGVARPIEDAYIARLQDFGFSDQVFIEGQWRVTATYDLWPNIDLVLDIDELDRGVYRRDNDPPHDFSWTTYGAALSLRYTLNPSGWFRVYAQAGAGLARSHTVYDRTGEPGTDDDSFWGYRLGAAAGLQLVPWQRLGFFMRWGYDYAPVVENLIGDVHDSGGLYNSIGLLTHF